MRILDRSLRALAAGLRAREFTSVDLWREARAAMDANEGRYHAYKLRLDHFAEGEARDADAAFAAGKDLGDSFMSTENLHHGLNRGGVRFFHEDVGKLMIDQSPGFAALEVDEFSPLILHFQKARLAEQTVGISDVIDWSDRVFAGDEP